MPRSLDLNRLAQFDARPAPAPVAKAAKPKRAKAAPPAETASQLAAPAAARWPSREPVRDGQVSIKAPEEVIERFRAMCRDDRRTYADMLGILMDAFEGAPKR